MLNRRNVREALQGAIRAGLNKEALEELDDALCISDLDAEITGEAITATQELIEIIRSVLEG